MTTRLKRTSDLDHGRCSESDGNQDEQEGRKQRAYVHGGDWRDTDKKESTDKEGVVGRAAHSALLVDLIP